KFRVGSLVLCNDYRHSVLLAKEVATLDLLSGGRFELGLGAGFSRREYEAAGLPYDPPGVRVGRRERVAQYSRKRRRCQRKTAGVTNTRGCRHPTLASQTQKRRSVGRSLGRATV